MEPATDNRSLASLFTDLTRDLSALIRQEVALARAEVAQKAGQVKAGLASLGAGGVVALVGLFFLVQAVVFGVAAILGNWLDDEITVWLAPLLVGLLAVIIGWVILSKGIRSISATNLTPERTARSLRRDAELAKEHTQ